jgi:hypothetical protein
MCAVDYPNHEFLHVEWHVTGAFFNSSAGTRDAYYGVSATPDVYFDGYDSQLGAADSVSAYNAYKPIIDAHLVDPAYSKFILDSHVNLDPGTLTGTITIDVEVAPGETVGNPQLCTIRAALTESGIFAPSEPRTNNTLWNDIGRLLITETQLTVAGNSGDTQQVVVPFAIDPTWNVDNLTAYAWVQRDSNKKTLQASLAVPSYSVAVADAGPPVLKTADLPGTYQADVTYDGVIADDVTVTLDKSALPAGWDAELEWMSTTYPSTVTIPGMTQGQMESVIIRTIPGPGAGLGTVSTRIEPVSNTSVGVTKTTHTFNNTPSVLYVDDDQGATSELAYTAAIAGGGYFSVNTEVLLDGNPETAVMDLYDAVVWNTGELPTGTIGNNVQAKITAYMDNGGTFFLASQGYLNHQGIKTFTSAYLGVASFTADGLAASATGVALDPIGDGLSFTVSPPFTEATDHITSGLGTAWLQAPGSETIGVRYDSGVFKSVFLAAPFEGIPAPDQATVMARVLEWLAGASGATDVSPIAAVGTDELTLWQNAPNPFRGVTSVRFAVPSAARVDVSVFDVAGRRIAGLMDASVDAGQHTATWDGRDTAGRRVASGVYLVRLQAGEKTLTREMVLLQ